ncbi:thiolase family protein [Dactylosporangium sp. AC04546]|uniref:thiolase family protein n=1 Tax=Dactylosporangium sp. AC04546 TaxID=2862460 RepID=UPI001EDCF111|nr:thiolase family protein [Dactylosporangium sp. AC04546]WVK80766.1 thiolase family protein [Dactylosporangium sp. AC04546]
MGGAALGGAIRGRTAIVAAGNSAQGTIPGLSADELAVEGLRITLAESGIDKSAIDGLITCKSYGGFGIDTEIGRLAGLNPAYSATLDYGTCNFSLHLACAVIDAGLASVVAIVYGTNQRSAGNRFSHPLGRQDEASVYGFLNVAGPAAMAFRRHQHLYGTTEADLARIAVSQRAYAADNPLAIFRDPLTVEDYLEMPYLVAPLRRPDVCMISDGAACLIVARADRARELTDRPVHVMGVAQQSGLRDRQNADQWMRPWIRQVAERVYPAAGIGRDGIDALYIQDPTSVWVLQMLEYYGFVEAGGVGEAFARGDVGFGGKLPLNTNGGQLSEAYMWGFLHLCEAVRQLRGDAGPRQIEGLRTAQYCSTFGFMKAASTILSTEVA